MTRPCPDIAKNIYITILPIAPIIPIPGKPRF